MAKGVRALLGGAGVLILDTREPAKVGTGKITGAVAVPWGLPEHAADPECPLHNPALDRAKRVILTRGSGGRGALASKTLRDMGLTDVSTWRAA